jgi:ketosteroid isomerase-like protein
LGSAGGDTIGQLPDHVNTEINRKPTQGWHIWRGGSEPHLELTVKEDQIREALNRHWRASAAGDADAEHDIYDDDAICDYPQSGERILGRSNLQALRSHHPGKPSGFNVKRILGKGDLWITEYMISYEGRSAYTVSIMEFRNDKVVHETQYFADPFEAPTWRSQWVQRDNPFAPGQSTS